MNKTIFILFSTLLIAFLSCSCTKDENKEINDLAEQNRLNTNQSKQKISDTEPAKTKVYGIKVIKQYDHNEKSFTQGLFVSKGNIYEGTGQFGTSGIHKIDVFTGKILKSKFNTPNIFGEGIALHKNLIYQLSWQNEKCFVYDINSFDLVDEFNYTGEGWGITNFNENLIMSDGSNILKIINPVDFKIVKSIIISDNGKPIYNLNELENINGDIWANIWMEDRIAIIDPVYGKIKAYVDLSSLKQYLINKEHRDVLNGIAYDKEKDKIYVTGKLWEYLFEIKLFDN